MNELIFKGCEDDWIATGLNGIAYHYYGLDLPPSRFIIVLPDNSQLRVIDFSNDEAENFARAHHKLMWEIKTKAIAETAAHYVEIIENTGGI